ncbi:hypothetical protein CNI01930 [Cryptococcus deneoformans JEC21]|uniref:Yeast cell wall synthesis Kre9/Knh1-like N-terminal domain-containing protein n=1 Tax=Cryptococcus deneoformans (strain JEC21 / ATCC MYA-565) TaxID=214684 RepID=Q5KBN8_CRYD1|nr:hypothetical protein CNI01930 [Cryptococcus neoformans var. neoformans JEC21]AAW45691.1 hypothetical protein CNI01930 [Cryptococcus neoformans var. neoformans JEC21]
MAARSILALSLAAAVAQAIQITAPSNSSGWDTHGSQLIKWTSVSTDPQNFTIAISKPNSSSRTDVVTTAVNTTDDSYIYMPSSDLKPGDGYRISFTSSDGGILAQSDEFSITDGTSTVSATASANSSTRTSSGVTVSLVDVSHTSKAASATQSSGAEQLTTVTSGLLMLAGGALAMLA